MDELRAWDAVATASAIADGQVTAAEVVGAATERAAAAAPIVGGVVAPLYAAARARVHDTRPHGPLGGVPTAIKEMVGIAGAPMALGSRAWHGNRAEHTWAAAREHLATGTVAIATTTMSEFGLSPTAEPLGRPPTRNPWALDHTAGGSSGGSAALVAAGVVPIALGTDGAGSIRVPASCCGLVGFKPSRGRSSGLVELGPAPIDVAVAGVLARSVRDVTTFHAALEQVATPRGGLRPIGSVTGPPPRRLRIGVMTAVPNGAIVDRDVVRAVEDAAGVLDDRGHLVTAVAPTPAGSFTDDILDYFGVLAVGMGAVGRRMVGPSHDPALFDPWTRGLVARGRGALLRLPVILARLRAAVARERARYAALDVVLSPVTTAPAPLLGHLGPTLSFEEHQRRVAAWIPFTPVQNVAGTPAVSVPSTPASTGLPVGVQLAGLIGDDALLLGLAHELEQHAPWPRLAPDPTPAHTG